MFLSGHSHSYERSHLLNGHYGDSDSLSRSRHILQKGDGINTDYRKPRCGGSGTIYVVTGSSAKRSGVDEHPAHDVSKNEYCSVVIEVEGARLTSTCVGVGERIVDRFTITKDLDPEDGCPSGTQPFGPSCQALPVTPAPTPAPTPVSSTQPEPVTPAPTTHCPTPTMAPTPMPMAPLPTFPPPPSTPFPLPMREPVSRSSKTCAELAFDSDRYGSPDVCGDTRWAPDRDTCADPMDIESARDWCEDAGARLCTHEELLNQETRNTGCGLNSEMVWSASRCATPVSSFAGFIAAMGRDGAQAMCFPYALDLLAGVRCCADV